MKESELIIIGAGIAGAAAAIYAKRSGLEFQLFEAKVVGGQLFLTESIDNYIGLGLGVKGRQLADTLGQTLNDLAIMPVNSQVKEVKIANNKVIVNTAQDQFRAQALIVATGASFRRLGIPGEGDLVGKGVSYCAVCDGFFFRGKEVVVVGGGNTAAEEALYLSDIAGKVTLIHRRDKLRALDYLQKDLKEKENIEILYDTIIREVRGSEFLEEIVIENVKSSHIRSLAVKGIFVAIGINPNTEIFADIIARDEAGFITTNEELKASSDFIWAAGDCRRRPLRQLITAAAEGAISAMSAYKYLRGHYIST